MIIKSKLEKFGIVGFIVSGIIGLVCLFIGLFCTIWGIPVSIIFYQVGTTCIIPLICFGIIMVATA